MWVETPSVVTVEESPVTLVGVETFSVVAVAQPQKSHCKTSTTSICQERAVSLTHPEKEGNQAP